MNRINQLFNSNKKDILSIYFCAGDPALDGTVQCHPYSRKTWRQHDRNRNPIQ